MRVLLVGEGTRAIALADALRDPGNRVDVRSETSDPHTSGDGARALAGQIVAFERLLASERPDAVLVASDGDAAVAAVIVATKLTVPVATLGEAGAGGHEAEVNRTLVESLADARLAYDPQAAASWVAGT
jgi:UDP-N-acetylglucosamine 2-epimerase